MPASTSRIEPQAMTARFTFSISVGDGTRTVTETELADYARIVGLDRAAPGHYSWLLVVQLIQAEAMGIDPSAIVDEIKALEGGKPRAGTKPSREFVREPLKGLWHKHFFSAHFVPQNLVNQLSSGKLKMLIESVINPDDAPVITREMITEIAQASTLGAFEEREAQSKLTGEWIVFAKHNGQNYYLCIATHQTGDEVIYGQIKSICFSQFPFLDPRV